MSAKLPEAKKPLAEAIRENWSDQLELGGSQSGYVACYAANQVLGGIWRGGKEDPDTKEIRDEATLSRVSRLRRRLSDGRGPRRAAAPVKAFAAAIGPNSELFGWRLTHKAKPAATPHDDRLGGEQSGMLIRDHALSARVAAGISCSPPVVSREHPCACPKNCG